LDFSVENFHCLTQYPVLWTGDAMEKVIRKIERELNVHVERMDVARDRAAERLFTLLSPEQLPPLLYHRESLQRIQQPSKGRASSKNDDSGNKGTIRIDEGRVRAWAKGRILTPLSELDVTTSSAPDMMITAEESGIDQDELMMTAGMNPLQRQGKEAIRQRTEERANNRKK
jgi:hypothetical protein